MYLKPLCRSVLETIGGTPLVALERLCRGVDGLVLAKLEMFEPGLSKKDRMALFIIREARGQGLLHEGQTVIELTSGNAGTGLAIVCSILGHPFVAVMSEGNSPERAVMMRAFGAEVILVPQAPESQPGRVSGEDLALVEQETQRITEERNGFRADQFGNPSNALAYEDGLALEVIEQAGGNVDAFCDFVGSGGTLAGCARAFSRWRPGFACYAVEPEGASVLAGKAATHPGHRIQGGGYAMPDLAQLRGVQVDGYVSVTDEEAVSAARRLAREEGILGGYSGGANVAAALKLLRGELQGRTVVVLICDSGMKYLSTGLWEQT